MPKLEVTQKRLDKRKYLVSQEKQRDMSGFMDYCEYCIHKGNCGLSQAEKETTNICAKAYEKKTNVNRKKTPKCDTDKDEERHPRKRESHIDDVLQGQNCDCQKYLEKYGKITNEEYKPKYVCPNCKQIHKIDNETMEWDIIMGKKTIGELYIK